MLPRPELGGDRYKHIDGVDDLVALGGSNPASPFSYIEQSSTPPPVLCNLGGRLACLPPRRRLDPIIHSFAANPSSDALARKAARSRVDAFLSGARVPLGSLPLCGEDSLG